MKYPQAYSWRFLHQISGPLSYHSIQCGRCLVRGVGIDVHSKLNIFALFYIYIISLLQCPQSGPFSIKKTYPRHELLTIVVADCIGFAIFLPGYIVGLHYGKGVGKLFGRNFQIFFFQYVDILIHIKYALHEKIVNCEHYIGCAQWSLCHSRWS